MAATIRLTVLTGPHRGTQYSFREPCGMTLGRSSSCDVCLRGEGRDQSISRRHCRLRFDPPNVVVDDLGSMNGTFLNGRPCADGRAPACARDGDILTIGGTSLQINIVDCAHWDEEKSAKTNCPVRC